MSSSLYEKRDQKEQERFLLDYMRSWYADFPDGDITWPKPPAPDVVVHGPKKRIGLEITRFSLDLDPEGKSLLNERLAFQSSVRERAEQLYRNKGLPPAWITVRFEDAQRFPKASRYVLNASHAARLIVQEIDQRIGQKPDFEEFSIVTTTESWGEVSTVIPKIKVSPSELGIPIWDNCQTAGQGDPTEILGLHIDRKNSKLDGYLQHCDEAWLVIVTDFYGVSSMFPPFVPKRVYESGFQRVLLLRGGGKKVEPLRIRRPTAS